MRYDGTGVSADEYPLLPEGWFPFRILSVTEGQSKAGNYQVVIDVGCLAPEHRNHQLRHWVTFLSKESKGAGMALHFLKCIGEPHEGVIDVNPREWIGKAFMGKVEVSEYQGKRNNKLAQISPIRDTEPVLQSEDNPFAGSAA